MDFVGSTPSSFPISVFMCSITGMSDRLVELTVRNQISTVPTVLKYSVEVDAAIHATISCLKNALIVSQHICV